MQLLGWIGFILVEAFYVAQLIKTVKTKDVAGFSLTAWGVLWWGWLFFLFSTFLSTDWDLL